jgi:choline-glycine betaine transporter
MMAYFIIGFVYLWLTIKLAKYEYENMLQGLFIVTMWPLAIVLLIIVTVFANKMTKDMEEEERQKDTFKHL